MTTNCKLPVCYPVSLNIDDDNLVEDFGIFDDIVNTLNPVTRVDTTLKLIGSPYTINQPPPDTPLAAPPIFLGPQPLTDDDKILLTKLELTQKDNWDVPNPVCPPNFQPYFDFDKANKDRCHIPHFETAVRICDMLNKNNITCDAVVKDSIGYETRSIKGTSQQSASPGLVTYFMKGKYITPSPPKESPPLPPPVLPPENLSKPPPPPPPFVPQPPPSPAPANNNIYIILSFIFLIIILILVGMYFMK